MWHRSEQIVLNTLNRPIWAPVAQLTRQRRQVVLQRQRGVAFQLARHRARTIIQAMVAQLARQGREVVLQRRRARGVTIVQHQLA